MVRIALTQSQSETIAHCDKPVEVVDADGRLVGVLTCIPSGPDDLPSVTANTIDQLIERVKEPVDNLLSTSEAIEQIRSRVNP